MSPEDVLVTTDQLCRTCLLPASYPGAQLNEDQQCRGCTLGWGMPGLRPVAELEGLLASRRGEQYDCLCFLSGGLDSSYQLYLAVKRFGLRVIAINYDGGFTHELAQQNQRVLCEALGVDFFRFRSAGQYERKFIRYYLAATRGTWNFWGTCAPCQSILKLLAGDQNLRGRIPFVLAGTNPYEKEMEMRYRKRKYLIFLRYLLRIAPHRYPAAVANATRAFLCLNRLKAEYRVFSKSMAPILGASDSSGENEIIAVDMSRYFAWDPFEIADLLRKEVGWETPESPEIPLRFDCRLEPFACYRAKDAFGITDFGRIYSNLIRGGLKRREEVEEDYNRVEDREHIEQSVRQLLDELESS